MLRAQGHRVNVMTPGRRVLQAILDGSPDLLLVSMSIPEPSALSVLRGVRQALGPDVATLVLFRQQADGVPNEADESDPRAHRPGRAGGASLSPPADPGGTACSLAEEPGAARPLQDVLVACSRWPGAPMPSSGTSPGSRAELLRAERGLVFLFDPDRRQMVGPTPRSRVHRRCRWRAPATPVDGEARSRWNFRKNGPLVSNKAQADTRLLTDLVTRDRHPVDPDRSHHAGAAVPRPAGRGRP